MNALPPALKNEHPILACVSVTGDSEAPLLAAASLAESSRAPLVVLHVVHEPGDHPGYYRRSGPRDASLPIDMIAERMLKHFLNEVRERHPELQSTLEMADVVLVSGIPQTRIPEVARRIEAQQIFIGSSKRGRLADRIRRATSAAGLRGEAIPVTTVPTSPQVWEHPAEAAAAKPISAFLATH